MKYIKIGNVYMSTRTRSGFLISAMPNTSTGTIKYKKTEYVEVDGAEYSDVLYQPRNIIVNGYIMARSNSEYKTHRRFLLRELNSKGLQDMEYFDGEKIYTARVLIDGTVNVGKELNKKVAPFSVNIIIPDFYLKAKETTVKRVYERKNLIEGEFIIPKEGIVFTARTNKATINNRGGIDTFVHIELRCFEEKNEKGIEIRNNSTGEFIKLNYQPRVNEIIQIDCERITVNSSINGNIINTVSPDSTFFKINKNGSELEVVTHGVVVTASFNELYIGV